MEILHIFGFINRGHLIKKFGVSTQQASTDLNAFMRKYPGIMTYNPNTKRYEATDVPRETKPKP